MKVLIDVPIEPEVLARLQESGRHTFDAVVPPAEVERELPAERICDAEVLFCTFPPTNLPDMPALRWIQIASTGYSQLFRHSLPTRGIRATNSRGCFDVPIAEWNIAMMINLARNVRQLIRNQDARVWDRGAVFQREIRGLTVGIWGYGGIGWPATSVSRSTCWCAKACGRRVLFTRCLAPEIRMVPCRTAFSGPARRKRSCLGWIF
jgi:phosphoglycerate dehydrogenase-like enzyme